MSNQKLFSPYNGINQQHLSDASVCYPGNPISTCVNFTPNTNIKTMSSNVYHGEVGRYARNLVQTSPEYMQPLCVGNCTWSKCSKPCGGGTQQKRCGSYDGYLLDAEDCVASITEATCNTHACSEWW